MESFTLPYYLVAAFILVLLLVVLFKALRKKEPEIWYSNQSLETKPPVTKPVSPGYQTYQPITPRPAEPETVLESELKLSAEIEKLEEPVKATVSEPAPVTLTAGSSEVDAIFETPKMKVTTNQPQTKTVETVTKPAVKTIVPGKRAGLDAHHRKAISSAYKHGDSVNAIAKDFAVSRDTVLRVIKYENKKALEAKEKRAAKKA